jgi:hypothetical protein
MKQLCWALAMGIAATASAQESVKLLPAPLELPTRIGPMQYDGKPNKYEPAALGVSYQYNAPGLSLTVYVYDAGVTSIPDGGDTPANCYLFEQTKREIGAAGYSEARLVSEQLARLSPPDDAPLAREAVFEFVRNGQPTLSYLWMTSVAKHFVKVRFSMNASYRHEAQQARRALLAAIGDAVKPHLAARNPQEGNSRVTLNVNSRAGADEMATGILYLTLLATLAQQTPAAMPLCGGEFLPPYETELSAFRMLLAMDVESTAGKLGKQLAAVTQAGFLEEFVWLERHREAWGGAMPEGLTLPEYQAWKRKKLKRFKSPQLGSVIFNHPRPMPLEASAAEE